MKWIRCLVVSLTLSSCTAHGRSWLCESKWNSFWECNMVLDLVSMNFLESLILCPCPSKGPMSASGVVVTEEERQWTVELLLLRRSASGQWSCCYIKWIIFVFTAGCWWRCVHCRLFTGARCWLFSILCAAPPLCLCLELLLSPQTTFTLK